MAKQNILLSVF